MQRGQSVFERNEGFSLPRLGNRFGCGFGSGAGWVSLHHTEGRMVMSNACVDMAQGDISMHTAFWQSVGMGIGAA